MYWICPYYLAQKAQEFGYNPEIILSGRRINDSMGSFVADQFIKALIKNNFLINKAKVLILGITFKENCPDIRNTGVVGIIKNLIDLGLDIDIYDPWANPNEVKNEYGFKSQKKLGTTKYEGIILAVAHSEFKKLKIDKLKKSSKSVVYDVKGVLKNSTHKL